MSRDLRRASTKGEDGEDQNETEKVVTNDIRRKMLFSEENKK